MYPPNVLVAPRLLDCVRPYVNSPFTSYIPAPVSLGLLLLLLLLLTICPPPPHHPTPTPTTPHLLLPPAHSSFFAQFWSQDRGLTQKWKWTKWPSNWPHMSYCVPAPGVQFVLHHSIMSINAKTLFSQVFFSPRFCLIANPNTSFQTQSLWLECLTLRFFYE